MSFSWFIPHGSLQGDDLGALFNAEGDQVSVQVSATHPDGHLVVFAEILAV